MNKIRYAITFSFVTLLAVGCSSGGGGKTSSKPASSSSAVSSASSSVAVQKGGTFNLSLKQAQVTRTVTGDKITVPATGVESGESTIR